MTTAIKKLGKLLMYTGETEMQIEFARQKLCKAKLFEPYAAFQRIDRQDKGYLVVKDIYKFIKDSGFTNFDETNVFHFLKYFDSTFERRLYYSDFLQIILPCDDVNLRAEVSQRKTYEVKKFQNLPFDIEKLLAKLIHKEIKFARKQQEFKFGIENDLSQLFKQIVEVNEKYIDRNNMKKFLVRCSYLPNDNLIIAIIRRMDLDCDAKLNQLEFTEAIRKQYEPAPSINKKQQTQFLRLKTPLIKRNSLDISQPFNSTQFSLSNNMHVPDSKSLKKSIRPKSSINLVENPNKQNAKSKIFLDYAIQSPNIHKEQYIFRKSSNSKQQNVSETQKFNLAEESPQKEQFLRQSSFILKQNQSPLRTSHPELVSYFNPTENLMRTKPIDYFKNESQLKTLSAQQSQKYQYSYIAYPNHSQLVENPFESDQYFKNIRQEKDTLQTSQHGSIHNSAAKEIQQNRKIRYNDEKYEPYISQIPVYQNDLRSTVQNKGYEVFRLNQNRRASPNRESIPSPHGSDFKPQSILKNKTFGIHNQISKSFQKNDYPVNNYQSNNSFGNQSLYQMGNQENSHGLNKTALIQEWILNGQISKHEIKKLLE